MMRNIALTIIIVLIGSSLSAQLLIIPKVGINQAKTTLQENQDLRVGDDWFGMYWEAGMEASWGFTNSWALGLGYTFSPQEPEVSSLTERPVSSLNYNRHHLTLRGKYAFLNYFFLNGGISYARMSGIELRHQDMFSSEDQSLDGVGTVGVNVGLELIVKKIVLGTSYSYELPSGSSNALFDQYQLVEFYIGYLFNLKVTSGNPWDKKCPKF